MEVTRFNFKDAKREFLEHLKDTDFISFDVEVTGNVFEERNKTDLPFENFIKFFQAANRYSIIQLGVCLFKTKPSTELNPKLPSYVQKSAEYEAYPFTFYLFPRTYDGLMLRDVSVEVSAMQFNVFKNGVDWNKWFASGVGFTDREERDYLRNLIYGTETKRVLDLSNKHIKKIASNMEKFNGWMKKGAYVKDDLNGILENELDNDKKAFVIKDLPLNVKLSLKKEIEKVGGNIFIQPIFNEESKTNDYKVMRFSDSAFSKLSNIMTEIKEIQFNDANGFSHLWDEMKKKIQLDNIPVVGHDCFYDMCFLFTHLEGNLSNDYVGFKAEMKNIFRGGVYDNKSLANAFEVDLRTLEAMHEELHEAGDHSVSIPSEQFNCLESNEHSAGKDAYMIGFSFIEFAKNLTTETVLNHKNIVNINPNILYNCNLNIPEEDQPRSKKVWVIVLKDKEANLLRVKNGCINKKGKLIKSKFELK